MEENTATEQEPVEIEAIQEESVETQEVETEPEERATSLSGRKAPTEDQLKGLAEPDKPESSESVKDTVPAPLADEKEKPGESEQKTETKAEKDEPKKPEIPPEVEERISNLNSGIAQERKRAQEFKQKVYTLQSQLAQKEKELEIVKEQTTADPGFEVLSEEDEIALAQEDSEEYARYNIQLRKHNALQAAKKEREQKEEMERETVKAKNQQIVNAAFESIKEAVPGIYDADRTILSNLSQVALDNGFDVNYLRGLSDPSTMVMFRNEHGTDYTEPELLGKGAKNLIVLLHKMSSMKGQSPEKLKAEIEEQIRTDEREKVNALWAEKLKKSGKEIPSLSDAPAAGQSEKQGKPKVLSRGKLYSMTDKERLAYLQGF